MYHTVKMVCLTCGEKRDRAPQAKKCLKPKCRGVLVPVGQAGICPYCKRPLERSPRKCADCKRPILKGHKWAWIERKGLSTVIHRNCANPICYTKET